jgi:hypothetical protein
MKGSRSFRRTAFHYFARPKLSSILVSLFLLLVRADTPQTTPLNNESVEIARSHLRQRHAAFEMLPDVSDLNQVAVMTFLVAPTFTSSSISRASRSSTAERT